MPARVPRPTTFALICATSAYTVAVTHSPDTAMDSQQRLSPELDPAETHHGAGLMATDRPVPFVASTRFLAGPSSDSTVALLGLSLANKALSFRRVSTQFEARYQGGQFHLVLHH